MLAVPAIVAAIDWLPKVSSFRAESELGNLFGPLSKLQAFGIWPVGDFRVRPHDIAPTYVLIAVVVGAGIVGLWWAWLAGDWFGESSVKVDGHEVGAKRAELNWPGLYTDLGASSLEPARTRSISRTTGAACTREAAGRRSRSVRSRSAVRMRAIPSKRSHRPSRGRSAADASTGSKRFAS